VPNSVEWYFLSGASLFQGLQRCAAALGAGEDGVGVRFGESGHCAFSPGCTVPRPLNARQAADPKRLEWYFLSIV
jgi:hypothetical protein